MRIFALLFVSVLLGVLTLYSSVSQAQDAPKSGSVFDNVSIGINAGTVLSYGYVRQYDWYPVSKFQNEWGFGAGVNIAKTMNPIFGLQGSFLIGTIHGTKRKDTIYYNGDVRELSLSGVVNLSNLLFATKANRKFTLYGTFGVGLVSFKSELFALNYIHSISASPLQKPRSYQPNDLIYGYGSGDTKRTTETVFPVAIGVKYKLTPKIDLSFETSVRYVNSEKLDVYSVTKNIKDKYGYTCLGFIYKFNGEKKESLEWQSPFEANNASLKGSQANIEGLTKDSDFDGVPDFFDKEPNTPEGVPVDGSGKALDVDGDGVPDYLDADPFSTKGAKVDENGIEIDSDGDGVPDSKDLEPNTPKGKLVNFQGIAIVGKEGAIHEADTKKPTQTNFDGNAISFIPSLYFGVNSANLGTDNIERLSIVAQILKAKPELKVKVVGHADKTGKSDLNLQLSKKRAQAVVDNLIKVYKIDASRLDIEFKGDEDPLADGFNYINRRVDFIPQK